MGRFMALLVAVSSISLVVCLGMDNSNNWSSDQIADQIGEALTHFMATMFDKDKITNEYDRQNYDTYTGLQILEKIKKNVTKQFKNSEMVLKNLRKSALESFYNYTGDSYDFDFLERFQYVTHKGEPVTYHHTSNFKRRVSVSNSSLVIPIDVYYNWTEVRETILWTAGMDKTFKANWSPNKTGSATTLQYIGTPHGVMRTYPSYYTPRVGKWVTYDHRFRIWYAVGAVESKKVVFLMDTSGTLAVRTGKLMRETAVNIIKTILSDEDYISVLTFNEFVEPLCCGAKFVRARGRIKNILIEQIRKIKPEGSANLTTAIKTGIEVLNNSKSIEVCHSTLVLFTDYTQRDIMHIFRTYNIDPAVKIVILQVGKDVLFASDLQKAATSLNGFHAKIEDLSDINPTILKLTSELYTSVVDDADIQVKPTPMYRDASTEEYITTLVVPVVTTKPANWTKPSELKQEKGSFLGVAAVDVEAKSLGQYPLSTARGCYAITVDTKGSVLYHPVLYGTKASIEFDQKLHLYSYLNDATTMKEIEQGVVFQNFTEEAERLYVEVSDSSVSKHVRSFANKYFFNVLAAIDDTTSLLHICNRKSLAFPKRTNVQKKAVRDVLPHNLGPQSDMTRDTAYCSYSNFSLNDFRDVLENESVDDFISRKLQFPECHDFAYEIFDDIYMVSNHLSSDLAKSVDASVTTAAGNRFQITRDKKLNRTNSACSRERYTRLINLATNSRKTTMLTVTDVSSDNSRSEMFEVSQLIYHNQSDSYPLMLSRNIPALKLKYIIDEPFREVRRKPRGNGYLVDENGFIIFSDADNAKGQHLAKLSPKLMEELLKKGIFNFFNHTECYFSCENVYPENTVPVQNAAYSMSRNLLHTSARIFINILVSTASVAANLLSHICFLILNPSLIASSMADSANQLKEDWRSIKIDLTCCHIHPFMSRNFSVEVAKGSYLAQDAACSQSHNYSTVPNTNLLFVWSTWCMDSSCSCQEPVYDLSTTTDHVLNPCTESDENYNPASHCTQSQDQIVDRQRDYTNSAVTSSSLTNGFVLFIIVAVIFYGS